MQLLEWDAQAYDALPLPHTRWGSRAIRRLQRAGLTGLEVELVTDSTVLERGAQSEAFLATVVLGAQLRELPAHQRHPFVHAVAEQLAEPVIDHVRLQIDATAPRRGYPK